MTAQYNVPLGYGTARFTFQVDGLADPMGFSIGVFSSTLSPVLQAANIAIQFREDITNNLAALGNTWVFTGVQLTTQLQGGPDLVISAANSRGTLAGPTVPPNCCLLVRKNTALGGRKNRGRLYAPAGLLQESTVDTAGFMGATDVLAFQTRWDAFHSSLVGLDINPFLFHQYDPALGELPEVPTAITSFTVQSQIATQRLRMR